MTDKANIPTELQPVADAENWEAAIEAATQLMQHDNPAYVARNFTELDANIDGQVTADEIAEAAGHQKPAPTPTVTNSEDCGCSRS